jgi:acetolactate synthase regulatory subunit
MKSLKFKKEFVLNALNANRAKHAKIYEEAMTSYRAKAAEILINTLSKVQGGKRFKLFFNLSEPMQYMKEYDRAIDMLTHSVDTESVELTQQEYAQYIQDDWAWQRDFLVGNSMYSGTAMQELDE